MSIAWQVVIGVLAGGWLGLIHWKIHVEAKAWREYGEKVIAESRRQSMVTEEMLRDLADEIADGTKDDGSSVQSAPRIRLWSLDEHGNPVRKTVG